MKLKEEFTNWKVGQKEEGLLEHSHGHLLNIVYGCHGLNWAYERVIPLRQNLRRHSLSGKCQFYTHPTWK